jgi:putative oxidoreductase
MQQIQNGLWNCLAAMGFLWLRCSFIIGSGRFGIDYLLTEN